MKSVFCALAYALAQHPDLLMEYLNTFHVLVKQRNSMTDEEYKLHSKLNNSEPISVLFPPEK